MPKEEKKENARRGAQKGRQARERSHPSPVDRNAVPVLKHGADNNYPTSKKKIAMAALEKFGDLGRMIELNAYWEGSQLRQTPPTTTWTMTLMVLTSATSVKLARSMAGRSPV